MNEELQKQLLAALKDLREGAPQAWAALVEEVAMRGQVMAICMGVAALLVALVSAIVMQWVSRTVDEYDRKPAVLAMAVFGCVCTAIPMSACIEAIEDAIAPSLALLEMLR